MFNKTDTGKGSFLEQTKAAREERANEKKRENAIIVVQSCVRGWLARLKYTRQILEEFDTAFAETSGQENKSENKHDLKPSIYIYHIANRFLTIWNCQRDRARLEKLCRYLVLSLENESPKYSYVGVALNKDFSLSWIRHIKSLLLKCCLTLETLRPEAQSDSLCLAVLLHTLVAYTGTSTWNVLKCKGLEVLKPGMSQLCHNVTGFLVQKGFYITVKCLLVRGLCRPRIALKAVSLNAVVTLSLRPLIYAEFTENLMTMFVIHLLSVPGLILHLTQIAPESVTALQSHNILDQCLELLGSEQSLRIIFHTLEGSHALCLLANLVHLFHLQEENNDTAYPVFSMVVTRLFETIQHYVVTKQSNLTHWHPMLGWFSQTPDPSLNESIGVVKKQIHLLWSQSTVKILLGTMLSTLSEGVETTDPPVSTSLLRRAMESRSSRSNTNKFIRKLGSPEVHKVATVCSMYHTALCTLTQLRLDILTGLCYNDSVLYGLWLLIHSLGPQCGIKAYLDILVVCPKITAPELHLLILFCDCMTHYVIILDDLEMYEQQNPFKLSDFIAMSNFLNMFLYKAIMGNLFDLKNLNANPLFASTHTLLLALYRRDCRRPFAPTGHWLAKDIRPSAFMADLEKGKKTTQTLLQKMPHVIPHEDRVQLFRRYVSNEKVVLGLTESACVSPQSTLITVHRDRIVEDGYTQLAALPPHALKGVIRVRFVNLQGLHEAGIDQDGVFKEFLEESIKRVFDPSLNLFRATSEERLYPSPTSHLQDSHLQLFEFVGRMLGKAVYEGIVVDVPFASFFLSQLLGQTQQALYSCMDELPSLDRDLYRSLTFIKHHQGDVSDLELMFSVDEDVLGRIVTHELLPGGRAIPVTNDNKINYIHLMAYFRMNTQIRDQTSAFIRGFRSIVNPDWLSLFSTPELQRLISGDTAPLDLRDLRRHTQYYGGFHDSHRVVGWLWDILARDFTEEERGLFLKFVTSCSKPPLLGFAHLEPPFSIRCVEVGDDEDTGDTIGSVIRGFFTIRKKDPLNRLPTSSTCFNLLKLPNYQKKSTLRDKLRYAVSSNTGFELS